MTLEDIYNYISPKKLFTTKHTPSRTMQYFKTNVGTLKVSRDRNQNITYMAIIAKE